MTGRPGIMPVRKAPMHSLRVGTAYVGAMVLVSALLIPVREVLVVPLLGNFAGIAIQLGMTCAAMAWSARYVANRGLRLPGWSREVVAVIVALAVLLSAESVVAMSVCVFAQ